MLGLLLMLLAAPQARAADLSACRLDGVAHEARCGTIQRALDPANEAGPRIDIHFAVLPALARQKKPDPVFFLAGGPGQSAIAMAGPISRMLARFGNRRDIVLVDQRGTGRSAALHCEEPSPFAPLRDTAQPKQQVRRALECLERLKTLPHGDLRHYTTRVAMADLDAVRRAVGAAQINLIGASYGTRAALDYLRQFPQSVKRVVLDGVVPPDMMLPEASAVDAQAALDALLQACDADPACRGRQPRRQWQALLDSMPREVVVPHPATGRGEALLIDREMLLGMVRAALYVPALGAALPAAFDEAADGNFAPLAGLAGAVGPVRGSTALAQGMHFSVVCAEDMPLGQKSETRVADFGAGLVRLYREVCAVWPRAAVPEAFYKVPPAPVAVLLLSGGIDPATPARHGERVARSLGALARHEVVPNAGHGLLGLGCLRDAVFRFIDAPTDADALRVDAGCASAIPRPSAYRPPAEAR